jgi:hypothetical protein
MSETGDLEDVIPLLGRQEAGRDGLIQRLSERHDRDAVLSRDPLELPLEREELGSAGSSGHEEGAVRHAQPPPCGAQRNHLGLLRAG